MGQSFQLNFATTLCEGLCWQEHKSQKQCTTTNVPFSKRLLGKLSRYGAGSPKAPQFLSRMGRHSCISPGPRIDPHALPRNVSDYHKDGAPSPSHGVQSELSGYDQFCSNNPLNDVHKEHDGHDSFISSSPSAAAARVNGVQSCPSAGVDSAQAAQARPFTCPDGVQYESGFHANTTSHMVSDDVQVAGQRECTSSKLANAATEIDEVEDLPCSSSTNPLKEAYQNVRGLATETTTGAPQDVTSSQNSPSMDKVETKGNIRRFSLNEPGLLKTLQAARALTPLEKENLELLMKFKRTNDNLQGQLVIRALRTEQLSDLENLLTDSYMELMWGPLTYRPVLAWIISTYLRERQSYLPHAVTLVGIYAPSDETNDIAVSSPKWWLAGVVEISFSKSGKPKGMQTPSPPEDAPFLSNMAVLERFRRRGIGRELLKAAEQLVVEMGGNEMYLHCRMIDEKPLNMYKNAGYEVVETDSILSLLLFQRRRHLMYKTLSTPLCQESDEPVDQISQA